MNFGSSAGQYVSIRAEVRKSFAFGVWIKDRSDRLLDLSDSRIHIVMRPRRQPGVDDSSNLIINSEASIESPRNGYARFALQASDLDHPVGVYDYSVTLIDAGYSSVLFKGELELVENTEFSSVDESYDPATPAQTVVVTLSDRTAVVVQAGPALAPGATSFLKSDQLKLQEIEAGAQVNVPANWTAGENEPGFIQGKPELGSAAFANVEELTLPAGGNTGEVLTKRSGSNFDTVWQYPPSGGGGGGGLDPTGIPAGQVPTASGVDGWAWRDPAPAPVLSVNGLTGSVMLDLDAVGDTATRAAVTPEDRDKLSAYPAQFSWLSLLDAPVIGSAAALDVTEVLKPFEVRGEDVTSGVVDPAFTPRMSELRGFSYGTAAPSGGVDGDIYFQIVV